MHDPYTQCWSISLPFGKPYEYPVLTIWHKDPEKDGTDDSCSWFMPKLNEKEQALAHSLTNNEIDNLRMWFSDQDPHEVEWRIARIMRIYKREFKWRYPVRWHFWHWRLQFHPWERFKRFYFERCDLCGERFHGGAVMSNWDGTTKWCEGCHHTIPATNDGEQ